MKYKLTNNHDNDICLLDTTTETTGLCGGDGGHGGVTRLTLRNQGGFRMGVQAVAGIGSGSDLDEVVLEVKGDAELRILADVLYSAGRYLTDVLSLEQTCKRATMKLSQMSNYVIDNTPPELRAK